MNAEAIASVAAAVVAFTQFIKWAGLPDRRGPIVVVALSLAFVGLWVYTHPAQADAGRGVIWEYATGWVTVTLTAAGVFGFTRAMPEAVTKTSGPPAGAGASPTDSMGGN